MRKTSLVLLSVCLCLGAARVSADEDWPQFRGPTGQGVSDSKGLPTTWSETQSIKWKAPLHGKAWSSPLVYKDLLIEDYDGSDGQFVIALDKNSGKTVWQTNRSVDYRDLGPDGKPKGEGDYRKAFSTCRIATVNGKPAVISIGSRATYAYEPESGKEIWRLEHADWHSAGATPVIGDGLIYICPGFGKGAVFAVRPDGQGVLGPDHIAFKVTKNAPDKQSPLLVGDLLYFIDSTGIATCVDAKTGAEVWRQRLAPNFSAAPLYGDGKIYFCGDDGTTTVVAAGRGF